MEFDLRSSNEPLPATSLAAERLMGAPLLPELFPRHSGGRASLPTREDLLDFGARLMNLSLGPRTAVLLPMTGMERALHFFQGFYSHFDVPVLPIATKSLGANRVDVSALREHPELDRAVVIDDCCCNTYQSIMTSISKDVRKDLLVLASKLSPYSLYVGGDLCITAVKRSDIPEWKSFSAALQEWRREENIGVYTTPNLGLLRALGWETVQSRSRYPESGTGSFRAEESGVTAELACAVAGISPPPQTDYWDLGKTWRELQSAVPQLPQAQFQRILESVEAYELYRQRSFFELGSELAIETLKNPQPRRTLQMQRYPYDCPWGPDPYLVRGE